jgi:hypothetical protein
MKTYELFETLASATWRTIISTHRNHVQLGEDAITSYNLNALACAGPMNVSFEDTRVDESTKGCDFELWIGSDAMGWYRYAVQAKKIGVKTGRYAQLGHKVGGVLQLDILERYAKANDAVPLYCFYNYVAGTVPWNCNYSIETEQLGCSVTPSTVVRAALKKRGGRSFAYIHKQRETLPWRCLVKCPNLIPSKSPKTILHAAPRLFPRLPESLLALRQVRLENADIDRGGLFNFDVELFPRYISVVDLGHIAIEEG